MSEDTTIRVRKKVKARLLELDFVKRQSENDLIEHLIDFYGSKNAKGGKK
jgi:hypothetical protein